MACNKQLTCADAIDDWYEDDPAWSCEGTQKDIEVSPGTYKE